MLKFKPAAGTIVGYDDGFKSWSYLITSYVPMGQIANLYNLDTGVYTQIIVVFQEHGKVVYNKNLTIIG